MASGYVYACDERGDLTKPVDENDPERNAIFARDVTNLIVDYHVANIPKGLCEGSTSLTSVRFENDRLDSIGDFAFAACAKLSFISFSDMHIGSIGAQAFAGCSSLTSLSIKKPAEIGALGEGCFLKSGLESTGLGNVKGRRPSLPTRTRGAKTCPIRGWAKTSRSPRSATGRSPTAPICT